MSLEKTAKGQIGWTVFIQRVNFGRQRQNQGGGSVAEPEGRSGTSKALNAAWVTPFPSLIFTEIAWDPAIRIEHFFTQDSLD